MCTLFTNSPTISEIEPDYSDEEDAESYDPSEPHSSSPADEDEEEEDLDDSDDNNWFDRNHRPFAPPANLEEVESDEDEEEITYRMHRRDYYKQKLNIDIRGTGKHPDEAFVEAALLPICREYVRTLQWVLDYYFKTVVDWKHYYPYHYAPFVSDLPFFTKRFLEGGSDHDKHDNWTDFEPDTKPLLPFEQQMFIMPVASHRILPECYRCLFTAESPVAEFFPDEFKTDLNGKLADWEAVVLIPFIDEVSLLSILTNFKID